MTQDEITQLQQQQALLTAALAALLQGRVTGEGSFEAYIYAIDPSLVGNIALDPPVVQSELEQLPKE